MPGGVQRLDQVLEFEDLLAALPAGGILVVRREIADRVVAPVVAKAAFDERRVLHELMNRQQFDGGDSEVLQVLDRDRMRETGVGAAQLLRNVRVRAAESLDVRFVHDRAMPRRVRLPIVAPVEEGIDDDAPGDERRAIEFVLRVLRVARSGTGKPLRSSPTSPSMAFA